MRLCLKATNSQQCFYYWFLRQNTESQKRKKTGAKRGRTQVPRCARVENQTQTNCFTKSISTRV